MRVGDPRAFGCVPTDYGRCDGVFGEDAGSADRPDQRRLLRVQPRDHRPDPEGPRGVGRARGVPGAAVRRPQGVRLRRLHLLARHGHARRLRPRFGRSGSRHRAVAGAEGATAARSWCTTAPRSRPARCSSAARSSGAAPRSAPAPGWTARSSSTACAIEAGSVIERSIIGFGARIGPRALIRDGVIGDGADIGARCELLRGARVWPGVHIPDGGIRYSTRRLSRARRGRPAHRRSRRATVERPPAQVHRLVADRDLRARRRVRHELHVEVARRHAQRAGQRMDVHRGQIGRDPQAVDAGLLGGLPQRRGERCRRRTPRSARRVAPSGPAADAGSAAPGCRCGRAPTPTR